jgi:hypothetical protein
MAYVFKGASPQSHAKHKRYAQASRHRNSQNFNAFLGVQAARLSTTAANIFALFAAKKRIAEQIQVATSYSASDVHGF